MNAPRRARLRKLMAAILAVIDEDEEVHRSEPEVAAARAARMRTVRPNGASKVDAIAARKAELWAELERLEKP